MVYVWHFDKAALISPGGEKCSTEAEIRSQTRHRRAVVTQRLQRMRSPVAAASTFESCSKRRSLMVSITPNANYFWSAPWLLFISSVVVSDHFSTDPAATPYNATGYQLVTQCQSICAEERAQISELLMSSMFWHSNLHVCSLTFVHRGWLFSGQDDVSSRVECMEQSTSCVVPGWMDPLTLAVTRQRVVSRTEKSVRGGPTRWRKSGCRWSGPFLRECGNRRSRKAQSFLLPHLQGGWGWHMGFTKAWDILNARNTSPGTNVFVLRPQGG